MVHVASVIASAGPGEVAAGLSPLSRTGRIFDIKRFSTHDGPGIRSTVFLTGCPLRCAWCHNPEAFVLHGVKDGTNVREMTVPALVRELERDVPYFDRSGGGVTISGGEPLCQPGFVRDLLATCRSRELHTALDTCGLVDPKVLAEAATLADLVLYDLKAMDPAVHAAWTGADNRTILENLQRLDDLSVPVWIRLPLVPGVNDDPRNLEAMIDLLSTTRFRRISILPYHRIADAKYQRLGLPNKMAGTEPPTPERIESVRARFAAAGFETHIGR